MNILVLGQGGREHAIVKAFLMSASTTKVFCSPGNAGIAEDVACIPLSTFSEILTFCQDSAIDFVFVGPEQPLVDGIAEELRRCGIPVVGPDRMGARLEGSKFYSKEFLNGASVPTAKFEVVRSEAQTIAAGGRMGLPCVVKADGLAAGKGVLICETQKDLEDAGQIMFEEKRFGSAGESAIVEEFLAGSELSYLILTNGREYQTLPLVQDHKRLLNGDEGPNTGGMGTVAPLSISDELDLKIRRVVIEPTLSHMVRTGMSYRGILFVGIMMTANGPSVLEFNVRFGDPEAQVILPLLNGDWAEIFSELAHGRLAEMNWSNQYSACVVLAAEGYPDHPKTGAKISAFGKQTPSFKKTGVDILHAGTARDEAENIIVKGGRVLNLVATDSKLESALKKIYDCAEQIKWTGCQFRTDIGEKVITNSNLFEGR